MMPGQQKVPCFLVWKQDKLNISKEYASHEEQTSAIDVLQTVYFLFN